MKGTWLKNLFVLGFQGKVSIRDAVNFIFARIMPKPVSFDFNQIHFENVDHIFWGVIADVYLNRVYFPANFDIRLNDLVVDIGAHQGGFTSYAARHTKNTVIAVEPDPINFSFLERLIKKNNLQNVIRLNAAIGSKSGRARFYVSGSSSRHTLIRDQGLINEAISEIEVEVISLDELLAKFEIVNLLKMDCEGAEVETLLNARQSTLNKIEKLVMETHDPFESPRMKELCNHIKISLPNIRMFDQKKENLGYIYAWKSIE